MKIVLEYTIPDDQYDIWCAYNARHLYTAITEIEQYVREVRKYDADPVKALDRIQDSIQELYATAGHPLNG
jgi:hypothetical protein